MLACGCEDLLKRAHETLLGRSEERQLLELHVVKK